ncbi:hypothetical protein F4775DRAFT_548159 [Biscogniauxia sp. FL1348]|nr:hypothetical protein F4775DRAFT_548159 [Biscogniauxia sp. FL1348]
MAWHGMCQSVFGCWFGWSSLVSVKCLYLGRYYVTNNIEVGNFWSCKVYKSMGKKRWRLGTGFQSIPLWLATDDVP